MHHIEALPSWTRRFRWSGPALVAVIAAVILTACGSSGSSSSSSAAATSSSAATSASTGASSGTSSAAGGSTSGLKSGLKVFVIPKNLGNSYFTVADSVKTGGALSVIKALGDDGTETSGSAATSASQLPAIQAAIAKGANVLIVSATDPTALCPTLKQAMARGITVVTYDSDAPTCRDLFINQASTAGIGTSQVDLLAKEVHDQGQIGIVSAAASATNQNAWIAYMKKELEKYPKMSLASIVYGNDDPTTATQVTSGLLQHYPHLAGIISPTTVGIAAAAGVLDTAQYRGKVQLTGLGTPLSMKKFVDDGTVQAFELWNPAKLGYLAAYAGIQLASKKLSATPGQSFTAGNLGKFTIASDKSVLLGPPQVFNKANIAQFNF
jgi:rhamnose transport system substrate-binding protein